MIIIVDGTYGIGKSSVCEVLQKELNMQFIDSDSLWNEFADKYKMAAFFGATEPQRKVKYLEYVRDKVKDNKNCILSMTLASDEARNVIVEYFNQNGLYYYHFILEASEKSIIQRIEKDAKNRDREFAKEHLRSNMDYLGVNYENAIRVNTEGKTLEQVAQNICQIFENCVNV